ncbi:MAG: hypothetical protein NTV63_03985 [Candidatus Woesearchaeota archaeon]|nr:hypothetical protein [Candidatus Woesearchaeota archaeon]
MIKNIVKTKKAREFISLYRWHLLAIIILLLLIIAAIIRIRIENMAPGYFAYPMPLN